MDDPIFDTPFLATADVPGIPERRRPLLRATLLEAVRGTDTSLSSAFRRPRRRLILAAACLSLLVLAGAAVALTRYDFIGEQNRIDESEWRPPALQRVGPREEIAGGSDWSFMAWKSESGVCVGYATSQANFWARSCGRPPGSLPDSAHGSRYVLIFGLAHDGPSDDHGAIFGAAEPSVAKVRFELADGRRLVAQTVRATGVDTSARFFVVRDRIPVPNGAVPVREVDSFAPDGSVLEQLPIAQQ